MEYKDQYFLFLDFLKEKTGDSYSSVVRLLSDKNRLFIAPAVSNPRMLAYITSEKLEKISDLLKISLTMSLTLCDHVFEKEVRERHFIMTKPGKLFRVLFPDFTDSDIQEMVALWYAKIAKTAPQEYHFIVYDDIQDIVNKYNEYSYESDKGTLGNSCMRHNKCEDWISFYGNYDVSLLCLENKETGLIKGRALIWHNVRFPYLEKDLDFMDRVYTVDENDVMLFYDYASANDAVRKEQQSMSSKHCFVYQGSAFSDKIRIESIREPDLDEDIFPYLDTLTYMNWEGNLSNQMLEDYIFELTDTEGKIERKYCIDCGDMILKYPRNAPEGVCVDCADNYTECDICGRFVHNDDAHSVDDGDRCVCENCYDEYYGTCYHCDSVFDQDSLMYSDDKHEYFCEKCYYDTHIKCEICGNYFHEDSSESITLCCDCLEREEEIIED